MNYVYILRCADDTYYTGWTNDLTARLTAHNNGRGAKYTKTRGPVRLAYSELLDTKSAAMQREYAIKQLTRAEKQALIDSAATEQGEKLTVYDNQLRPVGLFSRARVHQQGLYHRVVHLLVLSAREGQPGFWLQKRADDRPTLPGHFDWTSTGHMDPGEMPETAVLREAREEVGLALQKEQLTRVGTLRERVQRPAGTDDEEASIFLCRLCCEPVFAPGSEVAELVWVAAADFAAAAETQLSFPAISTQGEHLSIPWAQLCPHPGEWQQLLLPALQDLAL